MYCLVSILVSSYWYHTVRRRAEQVNDPFWNRLLLRRPFVGNDQLHRRFRGWGFPDPKVLVGSHRQADRSTSCDSISFGKPPEFTDAAGGSTYIPPREGSLNKHFGGCK